jgi:sugar phosphate isomerase/epimerase
MEWPLGEGSVGIERFLDKLKEVGFRGPLNIEREAENQQERMIDIAMAIQLLKQLTGRAV